MYFEHKHVETGPNCAHEPAAFLKYHMPLIFSDSILTQLFLSQFSIWKQYVLPMKIVEV